MAGNERRVEKVFCASGWCECALMEASNRVAWTHCACVKMIVHQSEKKTESGKKNFQILNVQFKFLYLTGSNSHCKNVK